MKVRAGLLSTLLSEAVAHSKIKGAKDTNLDSLTMKAVSKALKTVNSNLEIPGLSSSHKTEYLLEKEILESYLPKQLSQEEIADIVNGLPDKSVSVVMPFFKVYYPGKYDARELASYVKGL
jgi:uncharacterized protein YqeY